MPEPVDIADSVALVDKHGVCYRESSKKGLALGDGHQEVVRAIEVNSIVQVYVCICTLLVHRLGQLVGQCMCKVYICVRYTYSICAWSL